MFKQKALTPVIEYMHNYLLFGLKQLPTEDNYASFFERSRIVPSLEEFVDNDIKFMSIPTDMYFCHTYGQRGIIEAKSHEVEDLLEIKKFAYIYCIDVIENGFIIRGVTKEDIKKLDEEMKGRFDRMPLTEFPILK